MSCTFNKDYIISNRFMYGFDKNFNTQKFLESHHSPLATYEIKNKLTSELINEACNLDEKVFLANTFFKGINQRWMLVTIQKESSGISSKLSEHTMSRILGFGIPDSSPAHTETLGFENQIKYSAKQLIKYTSDIFQHQHNAFLNKKFIVDYGNRFATPVNQATLSSYLYTPHIGDKSFHGNEVPYGNYLFHLIWCKYFGNPH